MTPHIFQSTTLIKRPIHEVFDFFSRAENLNLITPPELQFEFVTKLPIQLKTGTHIQYRIRLSGIPFGWKTLISEWNPPHSFTDKQIKGPYRIWEHTHAFKALNDHTTQMEDTVKFLAPGWIFEPIINKFFIQKKVEAIFAFREQKLKEIFADQ